MEIYERIKARRAELNLSAEKVAEFLNVSRATIYRYESADIEKLPISIIEPLATVLQCSVSYLMGWDKPTTTKPKLKGVQIPVLGRVAAGVPIEAVEEIIDYEEITEDLAKTGDFFALQIKGDSMEPKFSNGDVVIVKKQEDAESGNIVIASINGDDATCKRLQKYKEGIALVATNPTYEPLRFTNEEIENKPIKIIGRVVELRAKF